MPKEKTILHASPAPLFSSLCLCRWFSAKDVEVPEAAFLDIILYSREQLVKVGRFQASMV
jgi:hypothetical protein